MENIKDKAAKQFGSLPERILQIGEGNFLRAFVDVTVEKANRSGDFDGSVIVCQPLSDSKKALFESQNCIYTVVTRGISNKKTVDETNIVTSISRYISIQSEYDSFIKAAEIPTLEAVVSNTTEAGICFNENDSLYDTPPKSYPAKLTAFLYHRYKFFMGDRSKGMLILPLELIEHNGDVLRNIVFEYAAKWDLERGFTQWMSDYCCFAPTLVDRIVTGYPRDEAETLCAKLGYDDRLIDVCEPYMFWAVEADEKWADKLSALKDNKNIVFCPDITPYRIRKVRILNGAHTMSALAAFLDGKNIVGEMMNDDAFLKFIKKGIYDEIIPTVSLPKEELDSFAEAVCERFSNPFVKHRLLDISLNSVSKFKARNLDTIKDYFNKNGSIPDCLALGLAALIKFYDCAYDEQNGCYCGKRGNEKYRVNDELEVLACFEQAHRNEKNAVHIIMTDRRLWGEDLTRISGFESKVSYYYEAINRLGVSEAVGLASGERK